MTAIVVSDLETITVNDAEDWGQQLLAWVASSRRGISRIVSKEPCMGRPGYSVFTVELS